MTWPEVSASNPPRILINVVLPEPDGPISATHSPPGFLRRCRPRRGASRIPSPTIRLPLANSRFTSEYGRGTNAGEPPQRKRAGNGNNHGDGHGKRIHNPARLCSHAEHRFS